MNRDTETTQAVKVETMAEETHMVVADPETITTSNRAVDAAEATAVTTKMTATVEGEAIPGQATAAAEAMVVRSPLVPSPHHQFSAANAPIPGQSSSFDGAHEAAARHAGNSGDSSLFSNALSFLGNKGKSEAENEDVDEDDAVRQHQNMYGSGGGQQPVGSGSMGTAAAMQALKMFGGGGGGSSGGYGGQSGGQGGMMGQAMVSRL